MISGEQIKGDLIGIYSGYLEDREDKEIRTKAYDIYTKYFNGADTLFSKNVSAGIWGSFDLSEGKLSDEQAKKILESLQGEK